MNRRRLNPRLRIQFLGLLMLLGLGALVQALVGSSRARNGMDGENSRQFGGNGAHSVGAR